MDTSLPPYQLSQKIRLANQQRENEKQSKFQQRQNDRVMNQTTAPTGLCGANKTVIPTKLEDDIIKILNNNDAVQTATKNLNTNLYNARNKNLF